MRVYRRGLDLNSKLFSLDLELRPSPLRERSSVVVLSNFNNIELIAALYSTLKILKYLLNLLRGFSL